MEQAAPIVQPTSIPQKPSVPRELCFWLIYSVILSLAQLWLLPILYYLSKKPLTLVALIGNGSLIFFATTITSKTAGDYFKKVKRHHEWGFLCGAVMGLIIICSVFAFAVEAAVRAELIKPELISPERVSSFSLVLALAAVIYSFAFTIIIRRHGD